MYLYIIYCFSVFYFHLIINVAILSLQAARSSQSLAEGGAAGLRADLGWLVRSRHR